VNYIHKCVLKGNTFYKAFSLKSSLHVISGTTNKTVRCYFAPSAINENKGLLDLRDAGIDLCLEFELYDSRDSKNQPVASKVNLADSTCVKYTVQHVPTIWKTQEE
jgi:hypothetical protein